MTQVRLARSSLGAARAVGCLILAVAVLGAAGGSGASASELPTSPGQVFLVQALPGGDVSISVDGGDPRTGIAPGRVVGPLHLSPGEHTMTVTGQDPDWTLDASVDIKPGRSVDVVLHWPAKASRQPVVTVYRDPVGGVAAGNGRVLMAHTATAPPADVEVDGKVAFDDVANGEYARADVPAGSHVVRVLPAGRSGPALLGPIDLVAPEGQLTAVYAVGNPADDSMDVVVHRLQLGVRGASAPDEVETGSAGLVDGVPVAGAAAQDPTGSSVGSTTGAGDLAALVLFGLFGFVVVTLAGATVPRRR